MKTPPVPTFAPDERPVRRGGIHLTIAALVASCGPEAAAPPRAVPPPTMVSVLEDGSFAGRLSDNNTFIAVVMSGNAIRAYVCDGPTSTWFDGSALRLPTMLTAADGTQLYLQKTNAGLAGSVRAADGRERSFNAPRTQQSALFRAETNVGGERYVGGWIVLADGDQRGSVSEGGQTFASRFVGNGVMAEGTQRAPTFLTPVRFEPAALRARTPNQLSFNIMGMGDSYASGEGAPEMNGDHGPDGVANQSGENVEVWDQRATTRSMRSGYVAPNYSVIQAAPFSPLSAGVSEERLAIACHRSGRNGTRVAADLLAAEWPEARVNAESFACSGAKVLDLVDRAYRGPNGPDNDGLVQAGGILLANRPQVEQVRSWLRENPTAGGIDAITVGIGGNDLGFADLIAVCLADPNCADDLPIPTPDHPLLGRTPRQIINEGIAGTGDEPSLATKFSRLATAISGLRALGSSSEVLLVDIPNPVSRPVPGTSRTEPCPGIDMIGIGNVGRALVTDEEARFIEAEVLRDFHAQIEGARSRHGWSLVDSHVARSAQHGFCTGNQAWFGTLFTGLERQGADVEPGPFGGLLAAVRLDPFFASTRVPPRISGGIGHPNLMYHTDGLGPVLADSLRPLLRARVRPLAPANLRVFAQRANDFIAVRWDDRATTETEFRVRVVPVAGAPCPLPAGGAACEERLRGPTFETEHTLPASQRGTYDVQVRACHAGRDTNFEECSAYTPALRVANFAPTVVPSGFVVRNEACVATNRCFPARIAWPRVSNADGTHVFYEVSADGRSHVTQDNFIELGAVSRFKVRSCNFIDCGPYSPEQTGPTRAATFLSSGQLTTRCQNLNTPPRITGEPSLDPAGLCR